MGKRCSVCQILKEPSEFNRNSSRKDGLQGKCRVCSKRLGKEHYQADITYYRTKMLSRRANTLELVRRLKEQPCVDCGGLFHFAAMDFDHLDESTKIGSIASLARYSGWSYERLLSEVAKCDLVCANCHRVRTYNRQQNKACRRSSKQYT